MSVVKNRVIRLLGNKIWIGKEHGFSFSANFDYIIFDLNTNNIRYGNIEDIKQYIKQKISFVEINDEKIQTKNMLLKRIGLLVFKKSNLKAFFLSDSFFPKKYLLLDFRKNKFLNTDDILDVAKYISENYDIRIDFEMFKQMFEKIENAYKLKNVSYDSILAFCLWKCSNLRQNDVSNLIGISDMIIRIWRRRFENLNFVSFV